MRRYESVCAKDASRDRAVALAPNSALAHDALAEALHASGNDAAGEDRGRARGRARPRSSRGAAPALEAHAYRLRVRVAAAVEIYSAAREALARRSALRARPCRRAGERRQAADAFATLDRRARAARPIRASTSARRRSPIAPNDFDARATRRRACDHRGRCARRTRARRVRTAQQGLGARHARPPRRGEPAARRGAAHVRRRGRSQRHRARDHRLGTLLEVEGRLRRRAQDVRGRRCGSSRELGNQTAIATVLLDLGQVLAESGDATSARARYEEALGIARQLSDVNLIEETLVNLGSVASKRRRRARGAQKSTPRRSHSRASTIITA